jgi:hypothetical protein
MDPKNFTMNDERIKLIVRNMELLLKQLELEVEDVDRVDKLIVYSLQYLLKSMELNLKVIYERKETN